jgi:urease gamma subunit
MAIRTASAATAASSSRIFHNPNTTTTTANTHSARYLHLTPRETDHLRLHQVGRLAQYRLARGVKLNHPEAVGLISMVMMEKIRDGMTSVTHLMELGQKLLGRNNVQTGIADLIGSVQIEATFPDGTKLLTIHSPIARDYGHLELALEGSFLPVPDNAIFEPDTEYHDSIILGGVMVGGEGDITLNPNASRIIEIPVTNTGDRPIQVRTLPKGALVLSLRRKRIQNSFHFSQMFHFVFLTLSLCPHRLDRIMHSLKPTGHSNLIGKQVSECV